MSTAYNPRKLRHNSISVSTPIPFPTPQRPNQWDTDTGPNWKRSDLQTVSEESGPLGRHYQPYTKETSNSVDLGI